MHNLNSPYIHAGTSDNFKELVLENSKQGPVLVNFWSAKTGQHLEQYPFLDQLIHDYDGRVLLVNIDTDSECVFTKDYGIASVPILKLFRNGRLAETLHGFQAENDIKKVLEQYVTRDSDVKLADAIELFTHGKAKAAYEYIAELIVDDPVNPRLPLTLCKLLHHEGRYLEAGKLIDSLPPETRQHKEIEQFSAMLSFFSELEEIVDSEALERHLADAPDDLGVKRQLVNLRVSQQRYEIALQLLEEIADIDPAFDEKYVQSATMNVMIILGEAHPLLKKCQTILRRYTH